MIRSLFIAALILISATRANAFLVNYDFEGIVTESYFTANVVNGDKMKGRLSFDPDKATPDDDANEFYDGAFRLPDFKMRVEIGPYIMTGGINVALFTDNGFEFLDMPLGNQTIATNSTFALYGDSLFDNSPTDTLAGGRWNRINEPLSPWELNTYPDGGTVLVSFTKLRYWAGDSAPTPEPGTMTLVASALLGFSGYRIRASKKRRKR